MKTSFFLTAGLIFLFFPGLDIPAHPHMWIRGQAIPELGRRGLESVRVIWDIDEMTSSTLILDYDQDGDDVLSPEEVDDIKTEAFDHLIEFEYYLFIGVNGTWVTSGRARNFRAYIENGRLIYDFVVPLKATIRWDDMTDLILFLFDSSYFIDFRSEDVVNLTVSHRNRDVVFRRTRKRFRTQGYGTVELTGLEAVSGNRR